MEATILHQDNVIIRIKGRLDTVTSAELDEKLAAEKMDADLVVFDFSEVEYISSAGLRLLLAVKKRLDEEKKNMEIHHINDVVREVFTVTGFIKALTIK